MPIQNRLNVPSRRAFPTPGPFLILLLSLTAAAFGQAASDPNAEAIDQILQGVHGIQEDPTRLKESIPWLEEEEARVIQEISEIEILLSELKNQTHAAESERLRLAERFRLGIQPLGGSESSGISPSIDFNRDIRPILSNNCVKCHGPDEGTRKAGLRLDLLSDAIGQTGVIRPGNSSESPFYERIATSDHADRMPPPESGKNLKPEEIALLKRWIDAGAPYSGHWAFEKPVQAPIPQVSQTSWVRNEIDSFVLAKLDDLGISPSEETDRYTLIRRLSLDLIGLPPTPTEVDDFIQDTSPNAYEKLVDRLLDSPHFGERWARIWLDLARYADTMGYEKDASRTIWKYRDWVIQALNEDKPFDEFTIEQLAGDLLDNPSQDQLIATAFHRNTMTNTEGGTDDEEFRNAAVVDRVNTTMEVWMGMTMGCAQCHTHKYDPISDREYYQFFAFFNQTEDRDQNDESPTMLCPDPDQKARLDSIDEQISLSRKLLISTEKNLDLTREEWEAEARSKYAETPRLGAWFSVGPFLESDYDLAKGRAIETPFFPEQGVDLDQTYQNGKLAWTPRPEWRDGVVHQATADYSATYLYRTIESATPQSFQVDVGFSGAAKLFLNGEPVQEFPQPKDNQLKKGAVDLPLMKGDNHLLLKIANRERDFEFSFDPVSTAIQADAWASLLLTPDLRTEDGQKAVKAFQRSVSPDIQRVETVLASLSEDREEWVKTIPTTPILRELPEDQRRETNIQVRGNFLDPGEKVNPGIPAVFHSFPEEAPLNRLGLARWLVNENNPLTARVVVNRYWSKFFGRGFVETAEDFGTQGNPPSNQALLDWLAVDFMEKGWSLKNLCKTIVTSSAYRQSSKHRPELDQVDPRNRFLARGPRFRLEAEMVRDQALRATGLLTAKMYGPSVMPPQPDGVWQVVYSGEQWVAEEDEDRYRRGLYTFWRRTSPYPSMVAFDAPSREVCTSLRVKTNTPLQALVTLNDPAYVEAAQALARRVVQEGGSVESKTTYAFRSVLVRTPSPKELDRLRSLFETELEHFQENPEAAVQLATQPLGPIENENLILEIAAWTAVGNVLLNLDETVTRL